MKSGVFVSLAVVAALAGSGAVHAAPEAQAEAPSAQAQTQNDARPAQWATPIKPSSNLYQLTPQLYRSAQPRQEDVALMQSLGIRTIINFRATNRDEDWFTMPGVTLVRIPMRTWKIGDRQIVSALKAIEEAQKNGPVLIHCQHGADRTGVVAAMYRVLHQGWTREQASNELRNGNYGFHGIWVNIPRYLESLDIERVRALMAHTDTPRPQ